MGMRVCPACGHRMRVVDGSQRTTRTAIYYLVRCENCLLELNGCKPRRSRRLRT